jgi:cellulose synthase/poly-beta-1,6-N-acetylglucosamine synthase-like glycosyltransferase
MTVPWFVGVSVLLLLPVAAGLLYLYVPAVASALRRPAPAAGSAPHHRFAILVPAHDEETVIGRTVQTLRGLDYPPELYDTYVVADYCTDRTAAVARGTGAICLERDEGPRGSKGAALSWLLQQVRSTGRAYDLLAVFDADTQVDAKFLRYMDRAFGQGRQAVQGQHIISNPHDGPYPALAWTMLTLYNRLQNQGRSNLGGSAKLMGDSVCFRPEALQWVDWEGNALTEDFELRLHLLLEGVRIAYLPEAIGRGEAPLTWAAARQQRRRWLQGSNEARRRFTLTLLREGLRRHDLALLDGALEALLPAYSPLVILTALLTAANLAVIGWVGLGAAVVWGAALGLLLLYPFAGLVLARAPAWAFRALVFGPFFILWRTGMDLAIRLGWRKATWVRTPRRDGAAK